MSNSRRRRIIARFKKVDSGLIQRLAISSSNKEEEVAEVGEIDEIIPEATIGGKEESQLIHREHDNEPRPQEPKNEGESLLPHEEHEENMATIEDHNKEQSLLEKTSIVGQSREAYGKQASIYVAFTMVASALCLALAPWK